MANADLPLVKPRSGSGAVPFSFGNTMMKNKVHETVNQYQDATKDRDNENI